MMLSQVRDPSLKEEREEIEEKPVCFPHSRKAAISRSCQFPYVYVFGHLTLAELGAGVRH